MKQYRWPNFSKCFQVSNIYLFFFIYSMQFLKHTIKIIQRAMKEAIKWF